VGPGFLLVELLDDRKHLCCGIDGGGFMYEHQFAIGEAVLIDFGFAQGVIGKVVRYNGNRWFSPSGAIVIPMCEVEFVNPKTGEKSVCTYREANNYDNGISQLKPAPSGAGSPDNYNVQAPFGPERNPGETLAQYLTRRAPEKNSIAFRRATRRRIASSAARRFIIDGRSAWLASGLRTCGTFAIAARIARTLPGRRAEKS
jgi:hypothetical protein